MKKGFTLIEILVIIAVLGVLASAVLFVLNPMDQIRKSNDAKRKASLGQVQSALELYYQDTGRYPASSSNFQLYINNVTISWGNSWMPYMSKLPTDPTFGKTFVYYSPASSNGQTYYLYANLERGAKDAQVCNAGNACTSITSGGAGAPSATACGGTCNYGVSSPNTVP
ncbi:MAG: type II secretion system protein GspG [Patescibacteria group bacterium]